MQISWLIGPLISCLLSHQPSRRLSCYHGGNSLVQTMAVRKSASAPFRKGKLSPDERQDIESLQSLIELLPNNEFQRYGITKYLWLRGKSMTDRFRSVVEAPLEGETQHRHSWAFQSMLAFFYHQGALYDTSRFDETRFLKTLEWLEEYLANDGLLPVIENSRVAVYMVLVNGIRNSAISTDPVILRALEVSSLLAERTFIASLIHHTWFNFEHSARIALSFARLLEHADTAPPHTEDLTDCILQILEYIESVCDPLEQPSQIRLSSLEHRCSTISRSP